MHSNHMNGYDSGDGDDIDMSIYMKKSKSNSTTTNSGERQTQEEHSRNIRKEASKIVRQSEYQQSVTAKCRSCQYIQRQTTTTAHSNSTTKSHMISQSPNVIVRYKTAAQSLAVGHCEIIPVTHCASYTLCDDETMIEIDRYKDAFVQYWKHQGQGMGVVFIETAIGLGSDRSHMVIDVIPQPIININDVPIYFKQVYYVCMCGGCDIYICVYFHDVLYIYTYITSQPHI